MLRFPPPGGFERVYVALRSCFHFVQKSPQDKVLVSVGLVCLGVASGLPGLASRFALPLPVPWIQQGLVVAGAVCFLRAVIRWAFQPPPRSTAPQPQPPPIVGTAPFGRSHGEFFARLGRHKELQEAVSFLSDQQTALVVIIGRMGVGKTSFVEAGLSHELTRLERPLPLYWAAEPQDPEARLLEAVRAQWGDEESAPSRLQDLIGRRGLPRRAVVVDQAERLSPKHHEAFFHLLRQAVESSPPYGLTWIVVLHPESWFDFRVVLRKVFDRRMQELFLTPFPMTEAETVVATLLDAAGLSIDKRVVRELLADVAVEGEILPADLGIHLLALTSIAHRRGLHGFTPESFRAIGGPLGLKIQYLKGQLGRLPPRVEEEATRALLQLVDPAAGAPHPDGRTGEELVHLVKPLHARELLAALDLLTSTSRLLLREAQPDGQETYRLPPGLAGAVQRIAGGPSLPAAEILDNAYRIWRSEPKDRYLLAGKDLRDVLRKRRELLLHEKDPGKGRFIDRSRRRRTRHRGMIIAGVLMILLGGFGATEWQEDLRHRQLLESWGLPQDLAKSRVEELTVPHAVTQVDWLPRTLERLSARNTRVESFRHLPSGLQRLDVAAAQGLTRLAELPGHLQELDISYTRITAAGGLPASLLRLRMGGPYARSLIGLPTKLEELELADSEIDSLEGLPETLRSFTLSRSDVISLEGLPQGVKSLVLKGTRIRSLAGLPPFLESLTLEKNEELTDVSSLQSAAYLRSLTLVDSPLPDPLPPHLASLSVTRGAWPDPARLPSSLAALTLIETDLAGLERLPPTVKSLALDAQRLDDLRCLPRTLTGLEVKWYPGKDLGGLPPKLERLSITFSRISSPQGIPQSVTELDLSGSDVTDLRGLPPGLVHLKLQGLKIRRLPPLPATLISLDLAGSTVEELGRLPQGLETLNLARTRVRTLAGLPRIGSLDLSGTPIRDLGDLPPELRELTLTPHQIKEIGDAVRSLKALHFVETQDSQGFTP